MSPYQPYRVPSYPAAITGRTRRSLAVSGSVRNSGTMFGVLRSSPFQLPGISVAAYTLTLPFSVFALFGCCDGLYLFSPVKSSRNFYLPKKNKKGPSWALFRRFLPYFVRRAPQKLHRSLRLVLRELRDEDGDVVAVAVAADGLRALGKIARRLRRGLLRQTFHVL